MEPLCLNCGFHCCAQCRAQNQKLWSKRVSKLSHWNDNALKQQIHFKKTLKSFNLTFILYNKKELVKTLCDHIYNTRNKEILSIFMNIIKHNDTVLLSAFYTQFQTAIHSRNISELLYLRNVTIINQKFFDEFKNKNGMNVLHYICTVNVHTNNTETNIKIIKFIVRVMIKYKLFYDIVSIFEFSTFCNGKYESEIINILDMFVNAEIKHRGLKPWIEGFSLQRLPLYDYISWKFHKKVPFYIMKWMVSNTINYKIIPYFLSKNDSHKFKTYNHIFYPLLCMEYIYVSYREIIYKFMSIFIETDSDIVSFKSCEKHSLPLCDAMMLNSNMCGTIMGLCKAELYRNYSLHLFIDIACVNPKLEYRVLEWIQICVEKYEKRLLFKQMKQISPLKYAETHSNYYCSQIILYLKRKQSKKDILRSQIVELSEEKCLQMITDKNTVNIAVDSNESLSNLSNESSIGLIDKLQNEIACLKEENLRWKQKYFKLKLANKSNENVNEHHRMHSYPTPKAIERRRVVCDDLKRDNHKFRVNGYREWDGNDIVNWIISLDSKYQKYENLLKSNIIKENIKGVHLSLLNRNDLARLGINDFGEKYNIVQQIRDLVQNCNRNLQKEGQSGNEENNNVHSFKYPSPYN